MYIYEKTISAKLEMFFKKNIFAVSLFQDCAIHPYSGFISFQLIEIIQA